MSNGNEQPCCENCALGKTYGVVHIRCERTPGASWLVKDLCCYWQEKEDKSKWEEIVR